MYTQSGILPPSPRYVFLFSIYCNPNNCKLSKTSFVFLKFYLFVYSSEREPEYHSGTWDARDQHLMLQGWTVSTASPPGLQNFCDVLSLDKEYIAIYISKNLNCYQSFFNTTTHAIKTNSKSKDIKYKNANSKSIVYMTLLFSLKRKYYKPRKEVRVIDTLKRWGRGNGQKN